MLTLSTMGNNYTTLSLLSFTFDYNNSILSALHAVLCEKQTPSRAVETLLLQGSSDAGINIIFMKVAAATPQRCYFTSYLQGQKAVRADVICAT